jgi:NAD(P)-dependent dehydrogenase (short-subunit alcohol dehydrogenase family)
MHPNIANGMTKIIRQTGYPAVSHSCPELSQAGKTVLVTGGSAGIGFSIAQAFIRAGAASMVLVNRRPDVLTSACTELKKQTSQSGKRTAVVGRVCDVINRTAVEALWSGFRDIIVDALVLNSAKFTKPKPLFDLGIEDLWAEFEANVRGPFDFAERFYKQSRDTP